jgi:hypothetical protein
VAISRRATLGDSTLLATVKYFKEMEKINPVIIQAQHPRDPASRGPYCNLTRARSAATAGGGGGGGGGGSRADGGGARRRKKGAKKIQNKDGREMEDEEEEYY